MSKRRFVCASLTLAGMIAGCGPQPPSSPTTRPSSAIVPPAPPVAPTATHADSPPPLQDPAVAPKPSAEIVAAEAQKYSQEIEQRLAKRNAARALSTTAPSAVVLPSAVKFADPNNGAARSAPSDAAVANPVISGSEAARLAKSTEITSIGTIVPNVPPSPVVIPPKSDVPFNKDMPVVNAPLAAGQPRPLPATDDLALRFAHQARDYPQDVASQLDWQLLQFLQGQSVPQVQALTGLSAEDREMLSSLLDGLTNFRNGLRADNNQLLSLKIRPIVELSDRLRTQAELTIPTLALCTDVKGFGVYEPIEARFEAGQEHRVIVYCEVENFVSLLDEQKRWQTKLTQEVVLYTDQGGLEVWKDKTASRPIIDYSRNRRHDFFIVKMIRLPANLTIGQYLLKVSVVDQQGKPTPRVAENTTPIHIVAQ